MAKKAETKTELIDRFKEEGCSALEAELKAERELSKRRERRIRDRIKRQEASYEKKALKLLKEMHADDFKQLLDDVKREDTERDSQASQTDTSGGESANEQSEVANATEDSSFGSYHNYGT